MGKSRTPARNVKEKGWDAVRSFTPGTFPSFSFFSISTTFPYFYTAHQAISVFTRPSAHQQKPVIAMMRLLLLLLLLRLTSSSHLTSS